MDGIPRPFMDPGPGVGFGASAGGFVRRRAGHDLRPARVRGPAGRGDGEGLKIDFFQFAHAGSPWECGSGPHPNITPFSFGAIRAFGYLERFPDNYMNSLETIDMDVHRKIDPHDRPGRLPASAFFTNLYLSGKDSRNEGKAGAL